MCTGPVLACSSTHATSSQSQHAARQVHWSCRAARAQRTGHLPHTFREHVATVATGGCCWMTWGTSTTDIVQKHVGLKLGCMASEAAGPQDQPTPGADKIDFWVGAFGASSSAWGVDAGAPVGGERCHGFGQKRRPSRQRIHFEDLPRARCSLGCKVSSVQPTQPKTPRLWLERAGIFGCSQSVRGRATSTASAIDR